MGDCVNITMVNVCYSHQKNNEIGANSIIHEIVHGILDTMGESKLSNSERFVCTFASLLVDPIEEIIKANMPREETNE